MIATPFFVAAAFAAGALAGVQVDNDFVQKALTHHNVHRDNHTASSLTWDDKLSQAAQQLTDNCVFEHATQDTYDGGVDGYGQNLASSTDGSIATAVTDMWYNGEFGAMEPLFGQADVGSAFESVGHLTQMVWSDTQRVGCGITDCSGSALGMTLIACNYYPAGNVLNEYGDQVHQPDGNPAIDDSWTSSS